MTLIFILELSTESLIGTVAYIFVVMYSLWLSDNKKYTLLIGFVASVFIITAFVILFERAGSYPVIITNRILSLLVIWLAVHLRFRFSRLSEERNIKSDQLSAMFENANEGILLTDKAGTITLANPFSEALFGYGSGELINKNISILIPEEFVESHLKHLEAFSKKPISTLKGNAFSGRHKNGNMFPVEISLSHFYRYQELAIIAFITDVTEKLQHQRLIEENVNNIENYNLLLKKEVKQRTNELEQLNQGLKQSQNLYKAMAHHFPGGIIGVLDKNMKYLIVDGKDLNLLKLSEEETLGKRIYDIHSALPVYTEGKLHNVFKGESISFDTEIEENYYNISSVPIPNASDEINEILVVVKNVTEQKSMEKHLLKNLEKEKELNLLKSRFVTLASHEFRSPLTTILSSTFLLEHYTGEQLNQERQKHLGRIKRSVNSMSELLNDFLSLGKLEEGKMILNYAKIDVRLFIEEFLMEISLVKKDGQVLRHRFEGENHSIVTDKQLLNNILRNLFSNAIKYTAPSGSIDFVVSSDDTNIIFRISDTGIGIPVEEQKHIYKRFFRAKNAADIQGTGLGLNIVRKYVKLLLGSIAFESRQNEGTTFTVCLPLLTNILKPSKSITNEL